MWHYIDDVLVETLLFGEEYALSTLDTGVQAAHGRRLGRSKGKGSSSSSNTANIGNSDAGADGVSGTGGNGAEANANHSASSVHHTKCDPNHLDENVTLHYVCAFVTD